MNKPSLIFYYLPTSAYALNVLIGALEKHNLDLEFDLRLPRKLDDLKSDIEEAINTGASSVTVLWSFFSASFELAKQQLSQIKSDCPESDLIHIAGGVHASAEPQQTLDVGFDFVATGEGEEIIIELAQCRLKNDDIRNASGLSWISGDATVSSKPSRRIELDDFPPFAIRNRRFNPIEITRGCIYACKFCQTPFMFKARFRHRSKENVVRYVRIMKERGLKDVRFISPTSLSYGSHDETVNLPAIESLLSSVRKEIGDDGKVFFGSFPSEIRPEHASHEAFQMLKKYISNDNIIIGAQSGSQAVLDSSKRGHGTEVIVQAVMYAIENGFTPNVDFLFGLPGETEREARESLRLADQLAELGARIHCHTFMPLPGTPYKDAEPGKISRKTERQLERLTSRGKLYGKWRQQVGIAEKMSEQQQDAKNLRTQYGPVRRLCK